MTEILDEGSHSVIDDELVHSSGPEGCPHSVHYGSAGVDVGDDLLLALGILRPFLQQQNLGLHSGGSNFNSVIEISLITVTGLYLIGIFSDITLLPKVRSGIQR